MSNFPFALNDIQQKWFSVTGSFVSSSAGTNYPKPSERIKVNKKCYFSIQVVNLRWSILKGRQIFILLMVLFKAEWSYCWTLLAVIHFPNFVHCDASKSCFSISASIIFQVLQFVCNPDILKNVHFRNISQP